MTAAVAACAPKDAPALLPALGAALRRDGKHEAAADAYLRAIAAASSSGGPAPARYLICAGFCLAKVGEFERAVELYNIVLGPCDSQGTCGDVHARLNRCACLLQLRRPLEGVADADAVIASGPPAATLAAALMNKGACLDAAGRREESIKAYELALSADAEAAAIAAGGEEAG